MDFLVLALIFVSAPAFVLAFTVELIGRGVERRAGFGWSLAVLVAEAAVLVGLVALLGSRIDRGMDDGTIDGPAGVGVLLLLGVAYLGAGVTFLCTLGFAAHRWRKQRGAAVPA